MKVLDNFRANQQGLLISIFQIKILIEEYRKFIQFETVSVQSVLNNAKIFNRIVRKSLNNILKFTPLSTDYFDDFLEEIGHKVKEIKESDPELFFGDINQLAYEIGMKNAARKEDRNSQT
mmetsp:Transcript_18935/g.16777  ORF Transcript_18935/g.16777 Transcript_18935/m.16777 type:complete len:120 (+) Transcript_18935:842-1201(+)